MSDEAQDKEAREHRGLIRLLVRWFVALYYPRIEIADSHRVPQTGPVLLCANHGNSLLDPVIIGIAADRPVRFMAKAPLFKHPILGPPMSALGMVPAFRGSDDARQVRRNLESLDIGAKVLVDGHAMGIFPEGKSTDMAHLEMVRSGAARMALQAVEQGAQGLLVVPLGLTYERKEQFRSSVLVRIGEPIDVQDLLQRQEGDIRKARRDLTSELQSRLKEVVVHLEEPQWEPWLEDLEILVPPSADVARTPGRPLWQRKRIADAMNYFLETDQSRAESVAEEIKAFRADVHAAGLAVGSQVLRMGGIMVAFRLAWNLCCLVLLLIPALLGTLHHIVPFVLVRKIASRMDQPGLKTISTHRMLVGVPFYLVWYAAVFVMLMFYDARFAWAWSISAPFAGLIALHYWRRAGRTVLMLYQEARVIVGRRQLKQLRQQLATLRGRLAGLAEEYAKVSPR
ncbi:MAG TPA: lysophospholipid acyltransferase family protein [Pirellulaceae bacterium]|nr:lysophospholipid acyltransferase family protein [Pirellulaceae bacterium]